jgi:nicotinamide-nucleotide amidase
MLPDLIRRGGVPQVGITVHQATITLRITAEGTSEAECLAAMQPTIATIHECLGTLVFGEENEELEHAVTRLLRERKQTLATCEIGTGGLVAKWLSEADAAGTVYLGGRIERRPLATSDADVSAVVAKLALACRQDLGADFGLAVGPLPAENAAEPSLLHIALSFSDGIEIKSTPHIGHPDILKARAGKQALNVLRILLRAT